MSTLTVRLQEYIAACFTGLYLQSHEHDDALREIAQLCRAQEWRLAVWDLHHGLRVSGDHATPLPEMQDPLALLRSLPGLAAPGGSTLLVLVNFHRLLNAPEIVQAVAQQITAGKQQRTFLLILAPLVQIPPELDKLFLVIEHELPDRAQLADIARSLATEPGELPAGPELEAVLDAAAGLTRLEAENAFSLALVRHQRLQPETLWELKTQALKKSGLLTLHRGQESFADLGGLDNLKQFCRRALARRGATTPVKPRGILLLGVPGTGKSAFAKALGRETGRPTLTLDVGALLGSLVGQTESNIRQALRLVEALSPCICFLDEVEKALSGVSASNPGDSGVAGRLFGTFLSWLSDHDREVFTVCTANDISRLPPEFVRAERFDGLFFLDVPIAADRDRIWQQYRQQFGIPAEQARPDDTDWTGAEVKSCCRLAALLDVPLTQAARQVVPVAVTAAEAMERLRTWASGRCLDASQPGIYQYHPTSAPAPRRRVTRNPTHN